MLQAKSILHSHDIGPMIISWNQMPHVIDDQTKKCIHPGWIVWEKVSLKLCPTEKAQV